MAALLSALMAHAHRLPSRTRTTTMSRTSMSSMTTMTMRSTNISTSTSTRRATTLFCRDKRREAPTTTTATSTSTTDNRASSFRRQQISHTFSHTDNIHRRGRSIRLFSSSSSTGDNGDADDGTTTTTTTTSNNNDNNNTPATGRPLSTRQQILSRFDADPTPPLKKKKNKNKKKNTTAAIKTAAAASAKIETEMQIQIQIQKQKRTCTIDTLDWLENVVIGYNLCPFAEQSMLNRQERQLDIDVVTGSNQMEILARVLGECLRLQHKPGTSLIVCPDLYPKNFLAFLEVYNVLIEGILPDNELEEDIQIAPFHPLFVFGDDGDGDNDDDEYEYDKGTANDNDHANDDLDNDAIENYTNRSPYPTFHILREAEVGKAVDALDGNAEKVWKRNVDFLRAMEDLFTTSSTYDDNESDDGNDDDDDNVTDKRERDDLMLLRSVFLKGKAGNNTNNNNNNNNNKKEVASPSSSSASSAVPSSPTVGKKEASAASCPVTTIQRKYENQIKSLLKEFRKKTY